MSGRREKRERPEDQPYLKSICRAVKRLHTSSPVPDALPSPSESFGGTDDVDTEPDAGPAHAQSQMETSDVASLAGRPSRLRAAAGRNNPRRRFARKTAFAPGAAAISPVLGNVARLAGEVGEAEALNPSTAAAARRPPRLISPSMTGPLEDIFSGSGGSEADVSGSSSDGGGSAVGAALPQLVDQMHLGSGGGGGGGNSSAANESARRPSAPVLISPRRGSMLNKAAAAASAASKMAVDPAPTAGGGSLGRSNAEIPSPRWGPAAQSSGPEPPRPRQAARSRDLPAQMHPARRTSAGEASPAPFADIAEPSTPSKDDSEARSPVKEGEAGAGRGFSAAELRAYERTNLLLRELHFERLGRLSIRDDDESSPPEKGRRSR